MTEDIQNTEPELHDKKYEAQVEQSVALFKAGYNCSQSVVAAFAPLFGIDEKTALRMSASFGGGIGRMRMTCGAACGMFMLAGLDCGATEGADRQGKSHNYAVVQQLAETFRQVNGSLVCAELLGLKKPEITAEAEARTDAYYKKRPCPRMIRNAAVIFANYLNEKD